MSDRAYYIAQIVFTITMVLVIVSAAGFEILEKLTIQAWIGSIMMLIAVATLANAAKMFRRVSH